MAYTLYLLQYNNYYNRQLKVEKDIVSTTSKSYYDYIVKYEINGELKEGIFRNINFIPNDGVETQQIINWYGPNPDYVIVEDNNSEEITRWFVIESTRTRGGQYALSLRRDLLADYFIQAISAPCFINKGMLEINDSFIFNKENSTYNQIKIEETLIKDPEAPNNVAWLTAYIDKKHEFPELNVGKIANVDFYGKGSLPFNGDENKIFSLPAEDFGIKFRHQIKPWDYSDTIFYQLETNQNSSYNDKWTNFSPAAGGGAESNVATYNVYKISESELVDYWNNDINAYLKSWTSKLAYNMIDIAADYDLDSYLQNGSINFITREQYNQIKAVSGKIMYENQKYYKITIEEIINNEVSNTISPNSLLGKDLIELAPQAIQQVQSNTYTLYKNTSTVRFVYTEVKIADYVSKTKITHAGTTLDQVYDIITIPYNREGTLVNFYDPNGTLLFQQDNLVALNVMTELAANNAAAVYDIQLLPYCPVRNCLVQQVVAGIKLPHIVVDSSKYAFDYITNTDGTEKKGLIMYAERSKNNFSIPYNYTKATTAIDKKIKSETEFFRIAAPGYDSTFEFNAEKNNGLPSFSVNMCFKPFSPFIHIAPEFGGLYGKSYQDMRGLTCNGDFSLSRTENAFATYELENKNYQRIFDRDIQKMEDTMNKVEIPRAIANTAIGMASTGIGGGLINPTMGAIGAVTSGLGGAANIALKGIQNELDIEYKRDRFQMQLQNIMALPNSLSKISAFCQNNKIFPVLEFYRATRKEQDALRDKIRWNGMTVNRIGYIRDFIYDQETYIQGNLIRIQDINDDMHIAIAMNNEVQRGFFINKKDIHIEF